MKRVFGYNTKLLKRNFKALLMFELLYKIIAAAFISPVIIFFIRLSVKWTGIRYLSGSNFKEYLISPSIIVMLLAIILILIFYTLFEITCIITYYDACRRNKSINVIDIYISGIKKIATFLKPSGIPIILLTGLLIPISGLPLFSGVLTDFRLPSFAYFTIETSNIVSLLIFLILLAIIIFSGFYVLSLHYVIIEDKKLSEAFKSTRNLIKNKKIKTIISIFLWYLIIAVALFLIYAIIIFIIALLIKQFNPSENSILTFFSALKIIKIIISFLYSCLAQPLILSIISALFFRLKNEKNEKIIGAQFYTFSKKKSYFIKKNILPLVFTFTLIINIVYISSNINNNVLNNIQMFRSMKISAHRGSSLSAPENTASSIRTAIKQSADFAEIDVHQTSDGKIVLLHDNNLKRTTGYNKNVWDVTYDDVIKLDAGSWFGKDFAGEKIPTLDDVIKLADGKIKLNIEIKPSKKERNIAESVVEIITKNKFEKKCIVTSFDYSILEKIKKINPSIQTGLISYMVFGNYKLIPSIDMLSLNYPFITKDEVHEIHKKGLKVCAWTVNNKDAIEYIAECGVDNIITDDPVFAKKVIYSQYHGSFVSELIKIVFDDYI